VHLIRFPHNKFTYLGDVEGSDFEVSKMFNINWTDAYFTVLFSFSFRPVLFTFVLNMQTTKKHSHMHHVNKSNAAFLISTNYGTSTL
jgi:hypothetical protein